MTEDNQPDDPHSPNGNSHDKTNYITLSGANKLRAELNELVTKTRPQITEIVSWAASLGDRSENGDYIYNKRKLHEIDRRIRFLTKRLQIAVVVEPTVGAVDTVRFGATVTIRLGNNETRVYTIVGTDEIDLKKGRISWLSPLGSALIKAKRGAKIQYISPKGEEELEIVKIEFLNLE